MDIENLSIMGNGTMVNRIKEIRNEKNLSLERVALACVPPTTPKQIQRLETGERKLTIEWIKRLAPALGVSSSDIVPEFFNSQDNEMELFYKLDEKNRKQATAIIRAIFEEQKKEEGNDYQ